MRLSFISFLTLFCVVHLQILAGEKLPPKTVKAMVVYSCDRNDFYPFPAQAMRDSVYSRLSGLYQTISYGQHKITFKEATDNGSYFISEFPASYYKKNYDRKKHVRGFGMFNEDILNKVKVRYGVDYFNDVDMIIVVGTDAGRDWYAKGVNATGFGMLGVDYHAGGKTFGKRQGQGGIAIEIGSDIGTPDGDDDRLNPLEVIYWTFAHEYGHWLKLGHRNHKLGVYSLMCNRLHGNDRMPEFGPVPLDIFHIMQLGWINEHDSSRVQILTDEIDSASVTLNPIRSRAGLILGRIDIPDSNDKFYLSYHRQNANRFDGAYMGEGLLIWHKKRNVIDVECAVAAGLNGKDHLDADVDLGGQATDFFNSSTQTEFIQFSLPDKHVGIAITDIREFGDRISFNVSFGSNSF